jgi:thiamine biosynthesis lipoprotein
MDRLSVDTNLRDEGDTCFFLRKKTSEMSFDPNGIAQGYAVDLIAQMAREQFGIERAMIQLGGEVRTLGRKAEKETWRIGVEKPTDPDEDRSLNAIAELENLSMATSGSYRKFYERDGERYPHVIDPRTGKPVQHQLLSVTVTHPSCTYADAYATAFMIMGSDKATTFVQEHEELEAYFIMAEGSSGYKTFATEGIKEILQEP